MNCPCCTNTLTQEHIEVITVDVCKNGCGGIWFDNQELKKVDESHNYHGELLFDIPVDESITVDHSADRHCPRCDNRKLLKHFFSPKHEIEIDSCYDCGGIWLDYSELRAIRKEQSATTAMQEDADTLLQEAIASYANDAHQSHEESMETFHDISNVLKFVCPSFYLKGKQEWGAF